jgi:hypothetical protein
MAISSKIMHRIRDKHYVRILYYIERKNLDIGIGKAMGR